MRPSARKRKKSHSGIPHVVCCCTLGRPNTGSKLWSPIVLLSLAWDESWDCIVHARNECSPILSCSNCAYQFGAVSGTHVQASNLCHTLCQPIVFVVDFQQLFEEVIANRNKDFWRFALFSNARKDTVPLKISVASLS